MLRLRADCPDESCDDLLSTLGDIKGVRRVTLADEEAGGHKVISADVNPGHADPVLSALHDAGLHSDDYVLVREETVTRRLSKGHPGGDFSWVEIVGEARANSRPVARYVALMMVAGWIAGVGVLVDSQILIIGAMAVSLDLLPLCSTCVGIAGGRMKLGIQAFGTLLMGLALVMAVAFVVGLGLHLFGVVNSSDVPDSGVIGEIAQPDYSTIMIALAAGVAGILSFETRAASAVGVAISVTTVPASAYFGVALAVGAISRAWGGLLVLGINLACLVVAGTITVIVQRALASED